MHNRCVMVQSLPYVKLPKSCKTTGSLIFHIHIYFEATGEMLPPAKAIFHQKIVSSDLCVCAHVSCAIMHSWLHMAHISCRFHNAHVLQWRRWGTYPKNILTYTCDVLTWGIGELECLTGQPWGPSHWISEIQSWLCNLLVCAVKLSFNLGRHCHMILLKQPRWKCHAFLLVPTLLMVQKSQTRSIVFNSLVVQKITSFVVYWCCLLRKGPLFHIHGEYDVFLRSGQDAWQGPYLLGAIDTYTYTPKIACAKC